MIIDTGTSEPVSQKPAKVIQESQSSWSAPIIVVSKSDGGKHLVVD